METPSEPALHPSVRLPRGHFRKLKKQEKRKRSRRDAASQRQALDVQEGGITEEGMDIDPTEEPEHTKQRKLWEVREEAFNKDNAIRRQIEEGERKKREIIQQNWERAVHSIATAQLSAVKTTAPPPVKTSAKSLTFVAAGTASNVESNFTETCLLYTKTGACRYGSTCARYHPVPTHGTTIVVRNMYEGMSSKLAEIVEDERLEIDEMQYERHFNEWFEDVHTEFLKFGRLVQFKVCRNHSPHLRGNVYIQYATETSAAAALEATQGRWFGGRQLTCEYVPLTKWKVAICGQFDRSQCPKLKLCNYLHPYRNPGDLYRNADRDFEQIPNATMERAGSAAMMAAAAAAAAITAALQKIETESNDASQSAVIHTEKPLYLDFQPTKQTKQTDSDTRAHRGEDKRYRRRNSESDRPEGDWSSSRRHRVRDRDFVRSKERYHGSRQRSPNKGNRDRGDRHCDHHDRHRSRRRDRSRERDDRKVKQRLLKSKSATDDRQSSQLALSPEYRPQSPSGLDEEKSGKEVKVDTVTERKLD